MQNESGDTPTARAANVACAKPTQTDTSPAAKFVAAGDTGVVPEPKDAWDRADVIAKVLGSVLIPIALGCLGYYGNNAIQKRTSSENQNAMESAAKLKRQELAMTVLLSSANVPELRQWAAGVFSEASGLSPKASKELEQTPLSTGVPKQAAAFVAGSEGCPLKSFQNAVGKWAIGCGHTEGVNRDTPPITEEQAEQLLAEDLKPTNDQISQLIKVPLTENQRTALVDFVFNVGVHTFATSTLLFKLNNRDYAGAGEQFAHWVRINGTTDPGLAARREREAALWDKPDGPMASEPQPSH